MAVGIGFVQGHVVHTLMKNCEVAEFGSDVRAMATVPTTFFKPLPASSWTGARVGFCCMSVPKPPPCTMKLSITR